MSRGRGVVQRAIIEAFAAEPGRRFTVGELAELAYPGRPIEKHYMDAVRRALIGVEQTYSLARSRVGVSGRRGWQYRIGLDDS
jgi:hypothetical protein